MGRLLSIDYGRKRSGIAVTDVLGIVANGLATVRSHLLVDFLRDYCSREPVDAIIVGLPRQMNGEESESMKYIRPFLKRLSEALPDVPVEMFDERFTSVLAHRAMIDGGMKKSDRRNRGEVDKISATIILNDYLASNPARLTK
ncbi:MAG: Holliday junction resolvase RuvX [Candidatus Limisoma sp.]